MAFFACHRAATKPDFGPDEHAVLRALAPHLQRAVSIHRRLGNLELERAASHRILDNLRAAVVFLDESGKVIAHNDAAERIFRQEDGLILTRLERLRAARSSDDGSLQRFIRDACATGTGKGMSAGGTLPIHRPSGRPYAVIVAPLALRQWPLLERRPAAVVFVSDPEDLVKPLAERLAPLFGLTPAEARLAAALAARQSLEDYAEQASLTIGTARWTLKRVLEKTGCRRQSELVHLLATSVAGLIRE
jgi:DNA-binding CsgD family transcriptional regulator